MSTEDQKPNGPAEQVRWDKNFTMDNLMTPQGVDTAHAIVFSHLSRCGKLFLYVDAEGGILHLDPTTEVAKVVSPCLVVDPAAIVDMDEEAGTITVSLKGVQALQHSGLILEPTDPEAGIDGYG